MNKYELKCHDVTREWNPGDSRYHVAFGDHIGIARMCDTLYELFDEVDQLEKLLHRVVEHSDDCPLNEDGRLCIGEHTIVVCDQMYGSTTKRTGLGHWELVSAGHGTGIFRIANMQRIES